MCIFWIPSPYLSYPFPDLCVFFCNCFYFVLLNIIYIFKDFIYLFIRDTQREKQRHRQKEKQAPRKQPDAGLDPGSPGPLPGLKAALNR